MNELYAADQKAITERELFEMSPLETTELFISENLLTVLKTDGIHYGFKVGDKVIREICPRCGGYGGEQVEDGWLSCYHCCEHGTVYTPLDDYIMYEHHLEALEDNFMHDMITEAVEELRMETLKLMQRQELRSGDPADAGINKEADFIEDVEEEDYIPF